MIKALAQSHGGYGHYERAAMFKVPREASDDDERPGSSTQREAKRSRNATRSKGKGKARQEEDSDDEVMEQEQEYPDEEDEEALAAAYEKLVAASMDSKRKHVGVRFTYT